MEARCPTYRLMSALPRRWRREHKPSSTAPQLASEALLRAAGAWPMRSGPGRLPDHARSIASLGNPSHDAVRGSQGTAVRRLRWRGASRRAPGGPQAKQRRLKGADFDDVSRLWRPSPSSIGFPTAVVPDAVVHAPPHPHTHTDCGGLWTPQGGLPGRDADAPRAHCAVWCCGCPQVGIGGTCYDPS